MDDDSGSGESAPMADVFYSNSSDMVSEPEPMSPESIDVKPVIRPSIIVPVKSKFIKLNVILLISKQK